MTVKERKGHFVCYQPRNFQKESLRTLEVVNKLIADYEQRGFSLTVRQIYYQLVQQILVKNNAGSYDRLQDLISNGRMAGLISWTALEDRGRNLMGNRHWTSPAHAIQTAEQEYRMSKWDDQPWRPEVWVEKQALEDVIGQICEKLDVDFFACKGYNSQSEQWRAGRRFARYIGQGQRPIVFHLGDHDPSGLDMTRDNRDRLSLFAGTPIMVQRLALNMPQIEEYGLPPNPAKESDGRFEEYVAAHGTRSSWELDALDPQVIQDLIEDAVSKIRDETIWEASLAVEIGDKRVLQQTAEQLGGVSGEQDDEDPDDA